MRQTPFKELILRNGRSYEYDVECPRNALPGPWTPFASTSKEPNFGHVKGVKWVRYLDNSYMGWHDSIMRVKEDGFLARFRHSDPTRRMDWPWYLEEQGLWRGGYVQYLYEDPFGVWFNEVWPTNFGALTLRVDRAEIYVRVKGSPCESVIIVGDRNRVHVYADPGPQSRLMLDRPSVMIRGHGNRVYGQATSQLGVLHFRGHDNHAIGFQADLIDSVGSDMGAFYTGAQKINGVKYGWVGSRFTRCRAVRHNALWLGVHGENGFYIDDRHKRARLIDCEAVGFTTGAQFHGAEYCKLYGFTAVACERPYRFDPHFQTKTKKPRGNRARRIKVRTLAATASEGKLSRSDADSS